MRFRTRIALALAAVPALLALATAPASAAGGHYDLTGWEGDIAGAWARGEIWQASDGRWHLNGTLTDTGNNDGKGAAFRIEAWYADGGIRYEEVWNTKGYGANVAIGEFNFASSLRVLYLQECILVRKADGSIHVGYCSGSRTVWSTVPN
ncbi:hypothetical protein ACFU53_39070 [Streptomyces sp. NPDC057474]|uniref:hypothetical protein n=1 Tax=Streptomyces sp. NPDC057474 TaxID=3346144 RepID=UPI00367B9F0B